MSSVDEVFRQMQAEQNEISVLSGEETIDSNDYCMLESDTTRRILIPEKYSIFGVESDEKVKTVKFAFPRYVDDGRLDLMDYQIRINYKTANPDEENNKDQVQAKNVHVVDDYVVFEWELSRRVTQYRGTITFIVCAVTAESNGEIITEWNTTIATSQSIEGLEVSPNENEETQARDLLTELLANLNNSKNDAITEITQTKTQVISDVKAEGQVQTSVVDAKGAQVLESIPDDYTTLENRVDELEQNRAYVIVGNGSGEFVTLNDSSELKTRNIKLFGKSVQSETTGAQLFNINKLKELDDGVEIIDYSTGEMKISQQNNAMPPVRLSDICPNMVEGQTYYLTGETTSNNKYLRVGAKQWNFDEALVLEESDLLAQCNFECTTQTGQSGEIIHYKDTFKHIMIVEGSSKKPYEVYTGGEAATEPAPEFPLPITSAGNYDAESEKYEVGIGVTGKNLFDASKIPTKSQGGVTVTNNGDGSFAISGSGTLSLTIYNYISYKGNAARILLKSGTLKFAKTGNTYPYFYFKITYDDEFIEIRTNDLSGTIVVNEKMLSANDIEIMLGYYGEINKEIKSGIVTPMLYYVPGNENYEPFKQQLSTLQLPNPLRGIPVDSGGNYTDADGQQWICDYIDRERGKYVQCVQEIVFDGSADEVWSFYPQYNNRASINLKSQGIKSNDYTNKVGLTNNFGYNSDVLYDTSRDGTGFILNNYILMVRMTGESDINSLELFKSWLAENNLITIFPLEVPIETDLTSDQLAALNLSTYQGITNVGTDTMPQVGVEVEYIADTKIYINNAISQAIAVLNQNE